MKSLKSIVHTLSLAKKEEQAWHITLIEQWPHIMGSLAPKISLQKISRSTLIVSVQNASWMQELYLMSKLLINKVNNFLGKTYITHISFTLQQKPKQRPTQRKKQPKNNNTQEKIYHLSKHEEQALQKIDDQELQQALQKFLQRCHQY